jgi:hypothetical protein
MSSRAKYDQFSNNIHIYGIDAYLYAYIKVMFNPNDSTVASVIESNLSFFSFFACPYRIEREMEREKKI